MGMEGESEAVIGGNVNMEEYRNRGRRFGRALSIA
jgi:hypothetical protein